MYDFIEGRLVEIDPLIAVIQAGGLGYSINISLNTYSALQPLAGGEALCKIYLHHIIREDAQLFYGFAEKSERALFRLLISVSGVGAATSRMILSSLSASELQSAIAGGDVNALKNVKGIGLKTSQRIIVELKDKMGGVASSEDKFSLVHNTSHEEALSALINLGFPKAGVEKVLEKLSKANPSASVEDLIKEALKTGI